MKEFHVIQVVEPGHNTSYKTGLNWCETHDSEESAENRASVFNYFRSSQCVGVEYRVYDHLPDDMNPVA